jgi:DnaJ-class molecular chaperone
MRNDQSADDCAACHGLGQEVRMKPARFGQPLPPYVACRECGGNGKTSRDHRFRAGADDRGI